MPDPVEALPLEDEAGGDGDDGDDEDDDGADDSGHSNRHALLARPRVQPVQVQPPVNGGNEAHRRTRAGHPDERDVHDRHQPSCRAVTLAIA